MLRVLVFFAGLLFATSAMAACEMERGAYLADRNKADELIACLDIALAAATSGTATMTVPVASSVATDGVWLAGDLCPEPVVPNPVTGGPIGGNPNALEVIRQSLLTYKLQSGLSDAAWWAALSTTTEPDAIRIIANKDRITGLLSADQFDVESFDVSKEVKAFGILDDKSFGLLKQVVPGKTVCLQ